MQPCVIREIITILDFLLGALVTMAKINLGCNICVLVFFNKVISTDHHLTYLYLIYL